MRTEYITVFFPSARLWLAAMALVAFAQMSSACIGSGICGGGGGCYSPPPASCGGGCQSGYSCGHYGCARNRARVHSSNTLAIGGGAAPGRRLAPVDRPAALLSSARQNGEASSADPNRDFLECCEDRGLPDACLRHCNFNTYTKEALMGMYFKTNACPIEAAAELQYCAARGRDHRACCARNSVHTTLAGDKCLIFCDQRPGNVTQLNFSYASCYDRFEQMKGCFWHGALAGH